MRLYARACAERDEQPPVETELALSRLLDFYLATAAGVYALERPGDRLVDHLEQTDHAGLAFGDRHAALDWLYAEADPLLACVRQASVRGGESLVLRRAVDLLWAAKDLAESGANSKEYEAVATLLRTAASKTGDVRAEGRAANALAYVHHYQGRFDQADREAESVVAAARSIGDPLPVCWALNARGAIAHYQARFGDADEHLTLAIALFREAGDPAGEAAALCNLSRIRLATGRTEDAVRMARKGADMYEEMGHALKGANGRYALGLALTEDGQLKAARDQLREALAVFADSRQRLWEGMTLFRIAEVDMADRRYGAAAAGAEMALTLLRGIGGEWRRGIVLTVLGRALDGIGQSGRARVCWQEALALYEELGAPEAAEVKGLLGRALAA